MTDTGEDAITSSDPHTRQTLRRDDLTHDPTNDIMPAYGLIPVTVSRAEDFRSLPGTSGYLAGCHQNSYSLWICYC